jgi:glutaminyl-peptide cyclotransferase
MRRAQAVILLAPLLASLSGKAADFSGANALEYTRKIVAFGPRPSGSEALRETQSLLLQELKSCGCQVSEDAFTAKTPAGQIAMKNIIARFPGTSGKALAVTGHYDTKRFPVFPFVGANDGGASAGFLLELVRALKDRPHKHDIYLVWFDGEEAVAEWTATDSLYGSRHLVAKWSASGELDKLQAVINVDMIGDKDLEIVEEQYSSEPLRRLVWQVAADLGHEKQFQGKALPIEDDHAPFLRHGVRAVDLIDFDYGPNHAWWHTADDTMDKLSASSFQTVGSVVVETLRRLD